MNKNVMVGVAILLVGGGAFHGGVKYAENNRGNGGGGRGAFGQMGNGGQRGVARGGGFTTGEVISKDDKSITLKLRDGGSKIIFFTESTKVMKNTDGPLKDIETGTQISTTGNANQDGSVNAQSIQILPMQSAKQ
ncbi:MAG: hypothetical protein HZA36_01435 [Parcubacteria group bacterium]|nr:hypothetical protein [Parcubacteria group bacterium]